MGKRKKDTYDEAKEQGTTLDDFIVPQRVTAFVDYYQPSTEGLHSESFNETRLRDFFKAWPVSLGDPLALYMGRLEANGFRLVVGSNGELAVFVTERNIQSKVLSATKLLE